MSKFCTSIPVDLDFVKTLLPKGAYLEAVRWNPGTNCVDVFFDHGPAFSGLDFATPWPTELLKDGKMPEGVKAKSEIRNPKSETRRPVKKRK